MKVYKGIILRSKQNLDIGDWTMSNKRNMYKTIQDILDPNWKQRSEKRNELNQLSSFRKRNQPR